MLHKLFKSTSIVSQEMNNVVEEENDKAIQYHISKLKDAIDTCHGWVNNHSIYRDPSLAIYGPNNKLSFRDVLQIINDTRDSIKTLEKIRNHESITREEKDSLMKIPELKRDKLISSYNTTNDSGCRLS